MATSFPRVAVVLKHSPPSVLPATRAGRSAAGMAEECWATGPNLFEPKLCPLTHLRPLLHGHHFCRQRDYAGRRSGELLARERRADVRTRR